MLPDPADVAGDRRFDLDALMIPAKEIGGDLYDLFKIDATRIYFAVGDVSGKGVPAALFMALGKSLCKSCAMRENHDLGATISEANAEISRDNREMLFITMFAGVLDLESGALRFCNAGHESPFLLRAGKAPSAVTSDGGPPLCVVDNFVYTADTIQLQPGDLICLVTDGATEAMTETGELLGVERLQKILGEISAKAMDAKAVVQELYAAIAHYQSGAIASDDLTILALRWQGPTAP
jgi:serine phosphatase RsbU (regulator of sigma subunit)